MEEDLKKILAGALLTAALLGSSAQAAPVDLLGSNVNLAIYLGVLPAENEMKIYMNGGADSKILFGSIGANDNSNGVRFESTDVVNPANGFASVKYTNVNKNDHSNDFGDLSITTPGKQFGDLLFSPQKAASFTVFAYSLNYLIGSYTFTGMGNNVDDILVLATGPYAITRVLLQALGGNGNGFSEVKHFEISDVVPYNGGINPSEVPLPAGLPLLMGGLGGMAWLSRRQKRKAVTPA